MLIDTKVDERERIKKKAKESNIILQNETLRKILLHVVDVSCGKLPMTHTDLGNMCWDMFNIGRLYEIEMLDYINKMAHRIGKDDTRYKCDVCGDTWFNCECVYKGKK